jgi:hypothetical protein
MNVQFTEDFVGLHTGGVKYMAGDVAELPDPDAWALVHRLGVAVQAADDAELTPVPNVTTPQTMKASTYPVGEGPGITFTDDQKRQIQDAEAIGARKRRRKAKG